MCKVVKRGISVMLVVVTLAAGLLGNTFVSNAVENSESKSAMCKVRVATPYKEYYYTYGYLRDKNSSNLKDDFGIGLPKDGSDGFSGIRALCDVLRRHIAGNDNIKGECDYTPEEVEKANAEMPKYIKGTMESDGFHLSALSPDGNGFNKDTAKNGKEDLTGSWCIFVDGKKENGSLSQIDVRNIKELEILWVGERNGKQGYGRFQTTDNSFIITADGKVYDGNGEKAEIKVVKDVYSDNGQMTTEAVSGASVSVYDRKENFLATLDRDENGYFILPLEQLEKWEYLRATEDVTSADGSYIYSRISRASASLTILQKPEKITGVKVKKNGKKAKGCVVKWGAIKNNSNGTSFSDEELTYQVYMSIKKDSGYKKVKTIDGYDSRKYTVKKKRTCYIKVRAVNSMNDLGENNKSIRVYGSWSKPVKVRIKK